MPFVVFRLLRTYVRSTISSKYFFRKLIAIIKSLNECSMYSSELIRRGTSRSKVGHREKQQFGLSGGSFLQRCGPQAFGCNKHDFKYRRPDGSCNNLQSPFLGQSEQVTLPWTCHSIIVQTHCLSPATALCMPQTYS